MMFGLPALEVYEHMDKNLELVDLTRPIQRAIPAFDESALAYVSSGRR